MMLMVGVHEPQAAMVVMLPLSSRMQCRCDREYMQCVVVAMNDELGVKVVTGYGAEADSGGMCHVGGAAVM